MLFRGITGLFQNRKANKIKPVDVTYQTSPYAKDQYGLAKQGLNARMGGAANQEQNILASQANMMGSVNRNASDGSQALAMAAAGQAQTDQSFADMGMQEAQNRMAMMQNFNQASGVMINEGDKVYQDGLRKYDNAVAAKAALRNAAWSNIGSAVNGATNMASSFMGDKGIGAGWGKKSANPGSPGLGGIQTMPGNTSINTGMIGAPGNARIPAGMQWNAPMMMNQDTYNAWNQPKVWQAPK